MLRVLKERSFPVRGWRLAIGFLVSPLIIPIPMLVVFGSASYLGVPKFRAADLSELMRRTLSFSVLVVMIGYAVNVFVAVPMVAWLLGRGQATRGRVLMLGAALGGLPFLAYFVLVATWELWRTAKFPSTSVLGFWATVVRLANDAPEALAWLAAGIGCGLATAGMLCLIASRSLDTA